jgi:hypothetical protein
VLIWNWDFTQFTITPSGVRGKVYIMGDDQNTDPISVSVAKDEALPFAIKWAHMTWAPVPANRSPLVLMIAILDMPADKYERFTIPGLHGGTTTSRTGYW